MPRWRILAQTWLSSEVKSLYGTGRGSRSWPRAHPPPLSHCWGRGAHLPSQRFNTDSTRVIENQSPKILEDVTHITTGAPSCSQVSAKNTSANQLTAACMLMYLMPSFLRAQPLYFEWGKAAPLYAHLFPTILAITKTALSTYKLMYLGYANDFRLSFWYVVNRDK